MNKGTFIRNSMKISCGKTLYKITVTVCMSFNMKYSQLRLKHRKRVAGMYCKKYTTTLFTSYSGRFLGGVKIVINFVP